MCRTPMCKPRFCACSRPASRSPMQLHGCTTNELALSRRPNRIILQRVVARRSRPDNLFLGSQLVPGEFPVLELSSIRVPSTRDSVSRNVPSTRILNFIVPLIRLIVFPTDGFPSSDDGVNENPRRSYRSRYREIGTSAALTLFLAVKLLARGAPRWRKPRAGERRDTHGEYEGAEKRRKREKEKKIEDEPTRASRNVHERPRVRAQRTPEVPGVQRDRT